MNKMHGLPRFTVYYNRFGYHVWDGLSREIAQQFGNDMTESSGVVPLDSAHCASLSTIKLWAEQCATEHDTVARYDPTGEEAPHLFDELIAAKNTEAWNKFKGGE